MRSMFHSNREPFAACNRSRLWHAAKRKGILKGDFFKMLEASWSAAMARPHVGLEQDRVIAR